MKNLQIILIVCLFCGFSITANALTLNTFNSTSSMPQNIPDNNATGVCVNFTASGMVASVQSVSVNLGLNHSWIGDLTAIIKSPSNTRSLKLFEKVDDGADDSIVIGNFNFTDSASANFWTSAINSTSSLVAGNYRTVDLNGTSTSLNTTFSGLTPAQANGTWQLCVADENVFDTGDITSATLNVETLSPTASNAFIVGKILTKGGRPIARAKVKIVNSSNGETLQTITNNFGKFSFNELATGNLYVLSVEHKQYIFTNQTINLTEDLDSLEIIGTPR
ncbi:MAG: carboxypeptidase regulatory-like domain-containing protein [Pyrinomonadaceae bacterium]|jgi:subtilisin-like proprotein convertase family protein|nr:carboxypeptidase regulatory-like domain-containing protein [Pyrinomonadaceae bacterium]